MTKFGLWKVTGKINTKGISYVSLFGGYIQDVFSEIAKIYGNNFSIIKFERVK